MFTIYYLAIFIFSDYKNLYLPSISHLYHHLFAELVHLYNLPLYWVCWGHKRFLVFDCKVVWERPSSSYTSHGLINLRSSTWGKFDAVLQNTTLGGPTTSTRIKLGSGHQLSIIFYYSMLLYYHSRILFKHLLADLYYFWALTY